MQQSRRKKLRARGWKLGSARELLGLSRVEELFIELRLKLADGLKARRQASGMSQVNLAKALKSSQSRVAKMEAGDPTVSIVADSRSRLILVSFFTGIGKRNSRNDV
jgi:hypothetical protein